MALIAANGFLFASFHFLLPTITVYAASLGATGAQIGLIGGIFGYSAIFIRLFTDTGVRAFGKKRCLYAGLLLCVASVLGYMLFPSADAGLWPVSAGRKPHLAVCGFHCRQPAGDYYGLCLQDEGSRDGTAADAASSFFYSQPSL